jgi:SagB-type dehydrogenase family enzyme
MTSQDPNPHAASLPSPQGKGKQSLEEVLTERRSVRSFRPDALSPQQIAQLCWAAQGVTDGATGRRTCPSAGALYPLELYVATAGGVEHYVPTGGSLQKVLDADVRGKLAGAALHQGFVEDAPAVFVITAVVSRMARKYAGRARRYVDMEVGHAGQNILLQAQALGLGAVAVGAFEDDQAARVLSLPADEEVLYLIPVGLL